MPLYWEADPDAEGVYLGEDGYPHRADGTRIFFTTMETPYPVRQYTYDDVVKTEYKFDLESGQGGNVKIPVLVLGAGNAAGTNQARIMKGTEGFDLTFLPNSEAVPEAYLRMTLDGKVLIHPLHISSVSDSFTRAAESENEEDKAHLAAVKTALGIESGVQVQIVEELPEGHETQNILYVIPED